MRLDRVGEVAGPWRLERLLGAGGTGEVYLASRIDGVVEMRAAVKLLRDAPGGEGETEAAVMHRLDHRHIARWLGEGRTADGQSYLAMEFVDGALITEFADQKGLSLEARLRLLMQACEAVDYAHEHLVLHLDLKPGNILVNRLGEVKIIDFGAARSLRDAASAAAAPAFSPPYASPEQLAGEPPGFAADTYALGAVLYELVSGHPPFSPHLSRAELERQIREEPPRPPSHAVRQPRIRHAGGESVRLEPERIARMRGGLSPGEARRALRGNIDRICLYALRKQAASRYQWCSDLRSDLEAVLEGGRPHTARSGDLVFRLRRAMRRNEIAVIAAVSVFALTVGLLVLQRMMSAVIALEREDERQVTQVIASTRALLERQLRPRLMADPRAVSARETVETVLAATAGRPRRQRR